MNSPLERVLVVDDDDSVRSFLCGFLKLRGYKVAEVECGPLAVARIRDPIHNPYDDDYGYAFDR